MDPFRITEREPRPGCIELLVSGELDRSVAELLSRAFDDVDESAAVVVSLADCSFIDSTGIALLVAAHRGMEERGRFLALYGASDQVHRALTLTGLGERWPLYDAIEDALAAASG